jgi:hypothetical protein
MFQDVQDLTKQVEEFRARLGASGELCQKLAEVLEKQQDTASLIDEFRRTSENQVKQLEIVHGRLDKIEDTVCKRLDIIARGAKKTRVLYLIGTGITVILVILALIL